MKNEATDLIDNKGSGLGRIGTKPPFEAKRRKSRVEELARGETFDGVINRLKSVREETGDPLAEEVLRPSRESR